MAALPNHYDMLGVMPKADATEIKRAYYAKMRQHHPDSLMAERARLHIVGDQNALRALEKRLDDAKKISQRLNIAYTILSDPDQRAAYDRQRRDEREHAIRAAQDDARIVVKSRPHRRPAATYAPSNTPSPAPKPDKFPIVWVVGFFMMLFVIFTFTSNFFGYGFKNTYVISPSKTPSGYIPAGSTDATATAQAHAIEKAMYLLTATPPTLETYLRAGDRLLEDGLFKYALDSYTHALLLEQTADTYVKRGRTYAALHQDADAQSDFAAAIALDMTFGAAYAERGLLIFAYWQTSQSANDAALARADLTQAQVLGDDSPSVQAALAQLP